MAESSGKSSEFKVRICLEGKESAYPESYIYEVFSELKVRDMSIGLSEIIDIAKSFQSSWEMSKFYLRANNSSSKIESFVFILITEFS